MVDEKMKSFYKELKERKEYLIKKLLGNKIAVKIKLRGEE